jgi:hypothetical protein
MTSDEQLRDLIEQEEAKQRKQLAWAVERGGLPIEADVSALYDDLNQSHDRLEDLLFRIEGIAESQGLEAELPFTVEFEHLGVIAVMADDVESRADDLQKLAKRLRGSISDLDMVRRNQEVQAGA